jgi:hypothetical protein
MEFQTYLVGLGLSGVTVTTHMQKYKRLQRDGLDYTDTISLLAYVNKRDTITKKLALCSTLIKYLQFMNLPCDALATYRYEHTREWNEHYVQRKSHSIHQVSYAQLIHCMHSFYTQHDWRSYVVLYAIVKLNATLSDLISTVIQVYEERHGSCFVISKNKKVVKWYRPERLDKIQSKSFVHAIQQLPYVLRTPEHSLPFSLDTIYKVVKRYKDTACNT